MITQLILHLSPLEEWKKDTFLRVDIAFSMVGEEIDPHFRLDQLI